RPSLSRTRARLVPSRGAHPRDSLTQTTERDPCRCVTQSGARRIGAVGAALVHRARTAARAAPPEPSTHTYGGGNMRVRCRRYVPVLFGALCASPPRLGPRPPGTITRRATIDRAV